MNNIHSHLGILHVSRHRGDFPLANIHTLVRECFEQVTEHVGYSNTLYVSVNHNASSRSWVGASSPLSTPRNTSMRHCVQPPLVSTAEDVAYLQIASMLPDESPGAVYAVLHA